MYVKQILDTKKSGDVLTIKPTSNIAAATEILAQHGVGALVVSSSGDKADGVLSERDIVRELARRGGHSLQQEVTSIMSSKVISCKPDDTADEVLTVMTKGRFRHMPVIENHVMIGLISIGDVVKARLDELSLEREALEGMISGH